MEKAEKLKLLAMVDTYETSIIYLAIFSTHVSAYIPICTRKKNVSTSYKLLKFKVKIFWDVNRLTSENTNPMAQHHTFKYPHPEQHRLEINWHRILVEFRALWKANFVIWISGRVPIYTASFLLIINKLTGTFQNQKQTFRQKINEHRKTNFRRSAPFSNYFVKLPP
jgi:hypothetical protein